MISTIRNPWIRRPLVVVLGPIVFALVMLCHILGDIEECARKEWRYIIVRGWRGG